MMQPLSTTMQPDSTTMPRPKRSCRNSSPIVSTFAHDRQHTLQQVCEKWELSPTGGLIKSLVKTILMYTSYRKQHASKIATISPRRGTEFCDEFCDVVQTLLDKVGTHYFPYSLPLPWQHDFWSQERPVWMNNCDQEMIKTGMLLLFEFLRDNDHGLDLSTAEPLDCFISANCDVCGGTKDQGGEIIQCHLCSVNYHLRCLDVQHNIGNRLVCATCARIKDLQEKDKNQTRAKQSSKRRRSNTNDGYSPEKYPPTPIRNRRSGERFPTITSGSSVPDASKLGGAGLQKAAATNIPSEDTSFKSAAWTPINQSLSHQRAHEPPIAFTSQTPPQPIIKTETPSSSQALSLTQKQKKGTVLLLKRHHGSEIWRSVQMSNIHDTETLFNACGMRFHDDFGNNTLSRLLLKLPDRVGVSGWMEILRGNEGDFEQLVRMIIAQWDIERDELYFPLIALKKGEEA